jgi:hypothetical protein
MYENTHNSEFTKTNLAEKRLPSARYHKPVIQKIKGNAFFRINRSDCVCTFCR